MDIESLKLFKVLTEEKNITRASERCNISQPAASIKIKKLEELYSAKFFNRTNRSFEITEEGDLFLETVDKIIELNQNIIINLNNRKRKYNKYLKIGATTGPANYLLPPKLVKYHLDNPEIYISLFVSDIDSIIESIQKDELDFGVVGTKKHDGMSYKAILQDEIILCSGIKTRIPDSIYKNDLSLYEMFLEQKTSSSRRFLLDWLQTNDVPIKDLNVVGEVGLPDALKHYLMNGEGIAFLPMILIKEELSLGILKRIEIIDLKPIYRNLYLVKDQNQILTSEAKNFIDDYL
jgi:DNA-binding transcriptional LysR family regulator